MEVVVKYWNGLPRGVVEYHPWRYPRDVDVALRDIHELVMALDR